MISNKFVSACNRFYALTLLFDLRNLTKRQEILSEKLVFLCVSAHSENFVILAITVLIQCQGVTDGRTDERFDDLTKLSEHVCRVSEYVTLHV